MEINSKFKPLYTSVDRYFVLTGGRGSGKSFAVSDFLLRLTYERGHVILFTRYTMISAMDSIIPEFIEKINLLGCDGHFYITKTEIVNTLTNSRIIFKGIKVSSGIQTAKLKSIVGVTTWVLDEAEELTDENVFDKIDESIRTTTNANRVLLILNPATADHWIYKRFFKQGQLPNVTYIHTTYLDNVNNLSKSFIDKINNIKALDPDSYKYRFLGAWIEKADGVVFPNWELGWSEDDLLTAFGQDYGYNPDPTTLIEVKIDTKQKIIYVQEHLYKAGLGTDQIAEVNKYFAGSKVIVADSAEPRLIDELRARGCNMVKAEKPAGSLLAGITQIWDYQLKVHPFSYNIQTELNNYVWLNRGGGLVIDSYNHTLDPLRYVVRYLVGAIPKKSIAPVPLNRNNRG